MTEQTLQDQWADMLSINAPLPRVIARAIRAELGIGPDGWPASIPWSPAGSWSFQAPDPGRADRRPTTVSVQLCGPTSDPHANVQMGGQDMGRTPPRIPCPGFEPVNIRKPRKDDFMPNQGRCPTCSKLVDTRRHNPPEGGKYYVWAEHSRPDGEKCPESGKPAGGR